MPKELVMMLVVMSQAAGFIVEKLFVSYRTDNHVSRG